MYIKISEHEIATINRKASTHSHLQLKDGLYLIRPFENWDEICGESKALMLDAIRVAKERYANNEDFLFVLRHIEKPDEPYAVLHFCEDGRIRNARKYMCTLIDEEDALLFIERFRKEVLIPYIGDMKG